MEDIKNDIIATIDTVKFNALREKCIREHGQEVWRNMFRDIFQRKFSMTWKGCHLCKSLDYEVIDGTWRRCGNCKTLYQPTAKARGHSPLNEAQVKRSNEIGFINRVRENILPLGDTGNIIDVGCGTGWLSQILKKEGHYNRIVALDLPNREMSTDVETYKVDMELDGVPEELKGQFDIVVNWQVIEHVKRPDLWFALMAELLKDKGILYCSYASEEKTQKLSPAEWRYSSLKGIDIVSEKYFRIVKSNPRSVIMEKR